MNGNAKGQFEVRLTPQALEQADGAPIVGRMRIDKIFRGELSATSRGTMLAVRTAVEGSAGYVAMELVEGELAGRRGAFVLQHSGTMTAGTQSLGLSVVPDSATGELAGLTGTMSIEIADGKHSYDFAYAFRESA